MFSRELEHILPHDRVQNDINSISVTPQLLSVLLQALLFLIPSNFLPIHNCSLLHTFERALPFHNTRLQLFRDFSLVLFIYYYNFSVLFGRAI